ncbi:MarR family transcriptional regulator, 2-MHQ and catechol-resistance regulon repressor [Virgibacillus subterraneus]|uniref:MarR family transcriptional regulator, 2-MHQ and catechol-resistance regulon repressor n=2 Tax=Virgibacillus TaxID=84406 RepID=A0A1H1FLN0_9BACI|nr:MULTISPECIES: MarR family transcriptional regulator [Virgibacillus]SDR01831.1 MarR family transcriptional regulator, 2-MHQ and catechol-resistance regulon repressor [Virgibacillus salinus]SEQ71966.1 MarR family transcriptional regulator, 2-MHQ and catechol-resistance regulon repressor [Virgibacillus subterraneus]
MNRNLSLNAFVVLMRASKSVEERIKKDIKSYGVSITEFTILEALYHKGDLTVNQICDAVLINSGSMTYVIDKLQQRGLLERITSEEDRRVIHVRITNQGKKLMDDIFPQHEKVIEKVFEDVSPEELESVIDILKRIGLESVKKK